MLNMFLLDKLTATTSAGDAIAEVTKLIIKDNAAAAHLDGKKILFTKILLSLSLIPQHRLWLQGAL